MRRRPGLRPTANLFVPMLPSSRRIGWRGAFYRILDRIGPVTRSAPARRAVQIVCLGLFCYAFFKVCWPHAKHFGTDTFSDTSLLPVDSFLLLDPLAGLSTALAGRFVNPVTWYWAAAIVVVCILIPRAFCGYLCPLGTLIDLFDWLVGRRFRRFHLPDNSRQRGWVHTKYYLLASLLAASLCGVLAAGWFAAIPILTRGMLFTGGRLQLALLKDTNQLAPVGPTFYLSVAWFAGVFLVSLRGRRFWCRYLCPSGALLSVLNYFRIGERKVETTCISCNRCVEICPFDAIEEDFTTRTADCTWCQTCGGSCPTHAIKFVTRWNRGNLLPAKDPRVEQPAGARVSRRGFVAALGVGAGYAMSCRLEHRIGASFREAPLRPPGSVPEDLFLDLCIRCGQCMKVCPGPVLHAAGLDDGLDALWTPVARPNHAGCHQDCNFCTQVCPTGAIQPLAIELKRKVHMGLARVVTDTCLPLREQSRQECELCYQECKQAGYAAIEMRWVQIPLDPPPPEGMFSELELEAMSRIRAPVVDANQCVGCGICQYRCHMRNVVQEHLLDNSAIVVFARNEHRLTTFPDTVDRLPRPNT